MSAPREIQIVGGGLAGLALGLMLRRREIPVQVFEAGSYPRHRVCGEFISGCGSQVLSHLGLLDALMKASAIEARTVRFHWKQKRTPIESLPSPALCVSRHTLDAALAKAFFAHGGVLHENNRWRGESHTEGVVIASGRKAAQARDAARVIGLKVHARGIPLQADLEVHFRADGYVGLCRLADGLVNVCGLFRLRAPMTDLANEWKALLAGPEGTDLHQRLNGAEIIENSYCAIAGLSVQPATPDPLTLSLGDAFGMIPPVTGNGMSLALESAEMAAPFLERYSRGEIDWASARQAANYMLKSEFRPRLRWAGWLHQAVLAPMGTAALFGTIRVFPAVWRALYRRTH